jgi:hypothetical protein
MKDNRTPQEKYAAWVNAVNEAHKKGWVHVIGWVFQNPAGKAFDLSAIDLTKLDLLV